AGDVSGFVQTDPADCPADPAVGGRSRTGVEEAGLWPARGFEQQDEDGRLIGGLNEKLEGVENVDRELQGGEDRREIRGEERTKELQKEVVERKQAEKLQRTAYEATRLLAESAIEDGVMPRLLEMICEEMNQDVASLWIAAEGAEAMSSAYIWHKPELPAD